MHFDLVDRVMELTPERIVTLKQVSMAEEYLQDHFATFPVLPGVMMLEAMVQAGRRLVESREDGRGLRMPLNVVLRGMYYHAAHYLPVAAGAAITVYGYRWLFQRFILPPESVTTYLYVLCAEVIVFSAFLFHTYWIGMRNMMYANR